jgi:hypothetical protein
MHVYASLGRGTVRIASVCQMTVDLDPQTTTEVTAERADQRPQNYGDRQPARRRGFAPLNRPLRAHGVTRHSLEESSC